MEGDLFDESDGDDADEETNFSPSLQAKHKAPNNLNAGIQQRPKKKPPPEPKRNIPIEHGKRTATAVDGKCNPDRRGRGVNPRYTGGKTPNAGVNSKKKAAPVDPDAVPPEIENAIVKANNVCYVVLTKGFQQSKTQVVRCTGCGRDIKVEEKIAPKNMLFRFRVQRLVPMGDDKKKWVMSKDKRNCYFHAETLDCLRMLYELRAVEITDVYMDNKSFRQLTQENKAVLRRREHWDAIVDGREKAKLHGHL